MIIEVGIQSFRRGQRVRIKGITDKGDLDLNGLHGKLGPKFEGIPFGVIGCYVDDHTGVRCRVNLQLGEFEILKKGSGADDAEYDQRSKDYVVTLKESKR